MISKIIIILFAILVLSSCSNKDLKTVTEDMSSFPVRTEALEQYSITSSYVENYIDKDAKTIIEDGKAVASYFEESPLSDSLTRM